nr:hypothetical protein [Candidatus Sigynarchaeota archaeon]
MGEPISRKVKKASREAKKAAKAREDLEKAELEPAVADYLEIVEDSPRSLTMRVHGRKYQTKVTIRDLNLFLYIVMGAIGLIAFFTISNPAISSQILTGNPMLGFVIYATISILIIILDVVMLYDRFTVIVDMERGIMKITRYPFPSRKEMALDRVAEFRKKGIHRFYTHTSSYSWSTSIDSVTIVLVDGARPAAKKELRILKGYSKQALVDVLVARLNNALRQYRKIPKETKFVPPRESG